MVESYLNSLRDIQPEVETKKKGVIYLNETQNFKLTTAGRGASERIGVFGGTGCQPAGSKVMMSDGSWKNVEEIKVGDRILSPQKDGSTVFANVTNTTKWFSEKNYKVYQKNKNKKELYSCSSNHIIPILERKPIRAKTKQRKEIGYSWQFKNISAETFASRGESFKQHKGIGFTSIPISHFENKSNCEIEPYTLGVFLGDGCFYSKRYLAPNVLISKRKIQPFRKMSNRVVSITSADIGIMNEVSKFYPIMNTAQQKENKSVQYYFSLNGELCSQLIKCGLEDKDSGTKFIPKEALYSDLLYRQRLLAGLIDTDGTYSGGYSITTKSKQLAEDILFLVHSLGGRGAITPVKKKCCNNGKIGDYFTVSLFLRDLILPLQVERKKKIKKSCYLEANRLAIDVIPDAEKKMVYGFELDSESKFYITDNFMVTHNSGKTYLTFAILSQFDGNVLFFDPQNRADIPLKSQDQIHKWEFLSVTEVFKQTTYVHKGLKKRSTKLMINASELNERSANVYARNKNDKKLRATLKQFCILKKELRLYKNLKYLCNKNKAMDLFNDLKFILHPHDKGMSLDELCRGKKIIDISTLTGQDRVVGVLIESILGHRALARDIEHPPLMVAIDECQRYCGGGQEIGNAIGGLCTTGRVFNIFVLIAGIVPRKLNTMIKGSLNVFFIFRLLSNDLEELVNYNIRLFPQDFEEFPKMYDEAKGEWIIRGWCFYFNIEAGMPDCVPLNFNLYFKKFERVVEDNINISPLFYKAQPTFNNKQSPLRKNFMD